MIDVGRVCVKIAGRETGKICVIVKKMDDNFVLVTGPKSVTNVKRRRCNIEHIEPLKFKLDIKKDASDSEVEAALKKEKVLQKMEPTDEIVKKAKKEAPADEPKKETNKPKPKKENLEKSEKKAKK